MPKKVVILGGGISGLATAWFLKKREGAAVEITVIEKSSRVGGWIRTENGEGFLFEKGPRSCRSKGNGAQTLALIESLGLQDQLIFAHPSARQRYLYHQKQLQPIPTQPMSLLFSSLFKGWLKILWRDWRASPRVLPDQTIYDFFSCRLGASWTERFIDPLVSGIYAGDIRRLSIKSCFPVFNVWAEQHGSLLKGALRSRQNKKLPPLFSLKGGMEVLPRTLAQQLDAHLLLNTEAIGLDWKKEGVKVLLDNGKVIEANQLISTLPAPSLSQLLAPFEVPYSTVAVVNLGFRHPVLKQEGFGYLVPSQEREQILGCVFDSAVFPQQSRGKGETRLTMMLGGVHHPEVAHLSDAECVEIAQETLERHLGISSLPDAVSVTMARQAIPQYEVSYGEKAAAYQRQWASYPLQLSGCLFSGVAVNDCIAHAEKN